ncbi:partial 30S ribosomal protein S4, partial [Anaerolineae bacterium]
ARQLVLHGHFSINGKKASVPSMVLKPGDTVAVLEDSRKSPYFQEIGKDLSRRSVAEWLSLNAQALSGSVLNLPSRQQIDTALKEQLIVEYYSR